MEAESPLPCPSNLTLERYELGELPPVQLTALHAHLRQCERCRGRLEEMYAQGASYRRTFSALHARNALHKADALWWRRTRLLLITPALASALVALVVLVLPRLEQAWHRSPPSRVQAALSSDELQLCVYAFHDGLTQEEISELLRLSRKTVGRRLRALAGRLRLALDANGLPERLGTRAAGLDEVASR